VHQQQRTTTAAMATKLATERLNAEKKTMRKNPMPQPGYARMSKNPDGSMNPLSWQCAVPGKDKTDWEGGVFPLRLDFPATYPSNPPAVWFCKPGTEHNLIDRGAFCHPNVYPDGRICLDVIGSAWEAGLTIKDILLAVQTFLDEPNNSDPASGDSYALFKENRKAYNEKVREQAKHYAP